MEINKIDNCYVAFLDILGFKDLLDKNNFEEIHSIFEEIRRFKPDPFVEFPAHEKIQFHIMSDSIIVYVDATMPDSFVSLTEVCYQIQIYLLRRKKPILLRGGIASGYLFRDKDVIFGTGLSRAYSLENELASYPRIIFTAATLNEGLKNSNLSRIWDELNMFYLMDNDDLYYIDFLHTSSYFKHILQDKDDETQASLEEYFEKLYDFVNNHLGYELNQSIRNKYVWLKDKIYTAIDNNQTLSKHFEELEKNRKEERRAVLKKIILEGD